MPNYRRLFVPGGCYCFTVNLLDRRSKLLTDNIETLRAAYGYVQSRHPFETVAICVLPDHLHCIWQLPPEEDDYPGRWRLLKSRFSRSPSTFRGYEERAAQRRARRLAVKVLGTLP